MKIYYKTIILFSLILVTGNLVLGCTNNDDNEIPIEQSEVYYIDAVDGSDSNAGNSPDKAWKSFENLKQVTLEPGNTVNLKKGSVWNDVFQFKGSGDSANPIMIKSYGEGDKPKIAAQGKPYALLIKNQEYIKIKRNMMIIMKKYLIYYLNKMNHFRSILFSNQFSYLYFIYLSFNTVN